MRFTAVLFDLGQTLLDYGPQTRWREYRIQRMKELQPLATQLWGAICHSADEFGEIVGGAIQTNRMRAVEHVGFSVPFRERLREALAGVGIRADDSGLERLTEAYNAPIREWPRPFPETPATLEQLRSRGVKLAIITNTPWDTASEPLYSDLERYGLRQHFSAFVGSGEVPWRKPNPEFMWAAATALGAAPEQCLVVGDNLMCDVAGAAAAGMKSVWVNRDAAAAPAEPVPDWVATSLCEVAAIVGTA